MKQAIITFASVLVLAGCAGQKTIENIDLTGKWAIESAMGVSTENAENPAFISFEDKGRIHGNASVNIFNGEYKLDGQRLSLTNIGMTRMMGASMEIEDAITEAINQVASVATADGRAYFFNAKNDTIMKLVKEDETQMCGAYSDQDELSKEDLELFNATYKGEVKLTPYTVSSQVVAGTNYAYTCKDKDGNTYKVVIFQPLPGQGDPEVTSVEKQ